MDRTRVGAILLGGGIGMIFVSAFREQNQEERRLLSESVLREIITNHRATAVVIDRIRNGYYENKDRAEVEADRDFEKIVQAEAISSHRL